MTAPTAERVPNFFFLCLCTRYIIKIMLQFSILVEVFVSKLDLVCIFKRSTFSNASWRTKKKILEKRGFFLKTLFILASSHNFKNILTIVELFIEILYFQFILVLYLHCIIIWRYITTICNYYFSCLFRMFVFIVCWSNTVIVYCVMYYGLHN